MRYLVVDEASGLIEKTVSADSIDLGRRYLKPGQALMVGPAGGVNARHLAVVDGVLIRRPDSDADGPVSGEGEAVSLASNKLWDFADA